MTEFNIIFTLAARQHIQKMLAKEHGVGLRLSIKKTGCSGFSYVSQVVSTVSNDDIKVNCETDLSVYIDPKWVKQLQNLVIDFVTSDDGFKKKLTFTSPSEGTRCGCGESFQLSNDHEIT